MTKILSTTFRLSWMATFMAVLLFSSCGKDNGDSKTTEVKLNGKWALRKEVSKDYENGKLLETDTDTYSGNDSYIEFKDGKFTLTDNSGDGSFTVTLPYTISSDSKKIKLTCSGEDCIVENGIMEIKTLDSKNLVLYVEETEEDDDVTYKYTTELHFVKI